MIALAGHGKDPQLLQLALPLSSSRKQKPKTKLPEGLKLGDRVRNLDDGEIGEVTFISDRCLNITTDKGTASHNLELFTPRLESLTNEEYQCLLTSIYSEELELSQKLVDEQEKSKLSPIATSTKTPKKSTETISKYLVSIPTSETITHPKGLIYIQADFLAREPQMLDTNKDSIIQNLRCGLSTYESSMKDSPNLLSLKTPSQSLITDYEQYLEDSEWLNIVGTIRKSYKALSLEAPKKEQDFLSLPTLTTGLGSRRNAGQTKLEKWLKDKGFRADTQVLSIEGMSVLFGFPPNWAKSLCSVPKELPAETMQELCLEEPSTLTVRSQLSKESSTSTELSANIDARLEFLLEQRDRLISSGASPQGVWINSGKVPNRDFVQVVWKSDKPQPQWGDKKSQYIGKFGSDEHKSAIAQHKAGQELRKIEKQIKLLQVK